MTQSDKILSRFTTKELFRLATELSKIIIFGPWTQDKHPNEFVRPEAGCRPEDSRARAWRSDGEPYSPAGWYFRIGFGVVGLPGISGTQPFETAEACMTHVDTYLAAAERVYLIGPSEAPQAAEEQ